MNKISIRFFDDREVRAVWDEEHSKWWFSVLDIIAVLTDQDDYEKNRNYWKYLKAKLKKENSQVVSATTQLKITAPDGKRRLSDMLDHDGIILLGKTFPGTKANRFIDWFTYSDNTIDEQSKKKAYALFESSLIDEIEVGTTTISQSFSTNTTSGNAIIAAISWGSGSATPSCSDTQGNTYQVATNAYDSTNNQSLGICYALNITGGSNTVTATFSSAASYRRLLIHEYSNLTGLDVTKTNIANATTATDNVTSTSTTTTQDGDLVFGAVMDDAGTTTITAGTNFTQRLSVNNTDLASQDMTQTTAGSIASTQTFGTAHRYLAQMAAFTTGGGGVDTTPPTITETTAISTYTKNQTPDYTFTSNEGGTITYSGDCASTTTTATQGSNTITLNTLQRGSHSNCTLTVTDSSGNESDPLTLSPFTVTYQSDANEDGTVNIFDYNLMIQNFGTTNDCSNPSDTDNDCDVDIFDYSILVGDFGQSV